MDIWKREELGAVLIERVHGILDGDIRKAGIGNECSSEHPFS